MNKFMKRSIATKAIGLGLALLIVLAVAWQRPRVSRAAGPPISLTELAGGFNNPIGVDVYEPTNQLIASANYDTGLPHNLDLIDALGNRTQYSPLVGLTDELKIATVRSSPCQVASGFAVGDLFTANGKPGELVKVAAGGGPASVTNPWVKLPGETAAIRGSLYVDRTCVFGGDLIVVTGNEQSDGPPNVGNVWRVTSGVNTGGIPMVSLLAVLDHHLEGVITVPNDPVKYGPAAGRILAGAEDLLNPSPGHLNYGSNGRIYGIGPSAGINGDVITIGADDLAHPEFVNYPTSSPIHPEDIDLIRRNANFYGVAFSQGRILTAPSLNFDNFCNDILITQEFPNGGFPYADFPPLPGKSGLFLFKWNAATLTFDLTEFDSGTQAIEQWEHVTFLTGEDCVVPSCNISINKQCSVPAPVSTNFVCSDAKPIDSLSMRWDGAQTINVTAWKGPIGSTIVGQVNNVAPGQSITISGFAGSPNDIIWEIFDAAAPGTKIGNSTFHVSCSDVDMNGPEDCGKTEGDGKGLSGFINQWTFEGMAGNGQVLSCNPATPIFTDNCTLDPGTPPSCADGVKPTSLTFKYTGGGCAASNNPQSGKALCSGSINPALPVTISSTLAGYSIAPSTVAPGGEFTVSAASFQAQSPFKLMNAGGTENLSIHTSCSQILEVGNIFGSLTLVAYNGLRAGSDVTYRYTVTNNGGPVTNVNVTDDQLGAIAGPLALAAGEVRVFEKTAQVTGNVTNVATVTANLVGGGSCNDSDTVTITRPPCTANITGGTSSVKDRQFKWPITNGGATKIVIQSLTLNWPAVNGTLKKVKVEGDVIWDGPASNPPLMIKTSDLTSDVNKRSIDPGKHEQLILEFDKNASPDLSAYSITVDFGGGCTLTYVPPPTPPQGNAVCSDLKPIDGIALQFNAAAVGGRTIIAVEWYRTTVADLDNPNLNDRVGTHGAIADDEVFNFTGFAAAGASNDVDFIVTLTGGTKIRSRFHRSCSDPDMNDISDCGKPQGDGKTNDAPNAPNIWLLRNLSGNNLSLGCP